MADKFEAQVSEWARQTEARLTATFRDAAQRVANETRQPVGAGGNMPVVTGNLRRSLAVSTVEMPQPRGGNERFETDPGQNITLTIARAQLGQTVYLGFQAIYARYQENRYGFVRLTAQRWPQIVREAAEAMKSRSGG